MKSIHYSSRHIFRENSPVTLKKGSRSLKPNQGFVLSNRCTFASFKKKFYPLASIDYIILRMSQHNYDLETGSKSDQLYSLSQRLLTVISLQEWSKSVHCSGDMAQQVIFQHFLSSCDLENRVNITEIYLVLLFLEIIHISMFGLS